MKLKDLGASTKSNIEFPTNTAEMAIGEYGWTHQECLEVNSKGDLINNPSSIQKRRKEFDLNPVVRMFNGTSVYECVAICVSGATGRSLDFVVPSNFRWRKARYPQGQSKHALPVRRVFRANSKKITNSSELQEMDKTVLFDVSIPSIV